MQTYRRIEEYKGQRYKNPYPANEIDPTLKLQKEFFLQVANAMMADYASNYCYVPFEFGSKRDFETLKRYLTGQQGSERLKDTVIGRSKRAQDGKYPTKMNISWDIYHILPKMYDIMRQKNMQAEYDVEVNCIDEDSLATKEADRATLKYLINPQTKDFLSRTKLNVQSEMNPEAMGIRNPEDVDLYFDTGGYSMQREIACVAACQKTKMVSGYKVTQDSTFDDLIAWALTGWKTYIDKSTKLPKIRKVHADRCIIPYSDLNDFSDITRAGEIRIMTIADIRRENPNLTSAELLYLAKCFSWMNPEYTQLLGSKGWYANNKQQYFGNYDVDPVSRVKVMVLDYQFLSVDIETNLKNERSDGSAFWKPIDFNFEQNEKSKKNGDKVIRKNVIRKYEAQWVIGTDMFLNYGVCKDVVYYGQDGNKTPKLDYFFVKTGNVSLAERCIAIVDDIDLAIIKQRNLLATVPAAPGMAIQKDLIENVFLNGQLQQPEDIISALQERGVLYFNGLDDHGKPLYMAGGQKPIDYLDVTKIVGALQTYGNLILQKVNELREVLGLNQASDASTPSPYQGLGKTQLAVEATNAALYPTFNAYTYLFKNAFEDIIRKWQVIAKDETAKKIGFSPLGAKSLKILELGKDFTNAEFNIDIRMGITDQEKAQLLQDITQQKAIGTQTGGAQGLTTAEYMYVYDRIIAGNIKEAMFVLSKIEQKKAEAKRQADIQNQQMTFQGQQQSAMIAEQAKQQTIQVEQGEKGFNALLLQIVQDLGKNNNILTEQLLKSKEQTMQPLSDVAVQNQINTNNQQIAGVVAQSMPQRPNTAPQEQDLPQDGSQIPPEQIEAPMV